MFKKKRIYLDNSASTPTDLKVLKAMKRYWCKEYGNSGSLHYEGVVAEKAVNEARKIIAGFFAGHSDEIIFTSSGTESNNLAILGVARNGNLENAHFITTNIEHRSVLAPFKYLETKGVTVDYLPVEENGILNPEKIKNSLKENTVLVSVMYVNNEIGTIQPIREITKIIRDFNKKTTGQKVIFHVDACQAVGYLDMNVARLGADLISASSSKIYGPKGVGFLYKKRGVEIKPIIFGGRQEFGLRSGSLNVPAIVGAGESVRLLSEQTEDEKLKKMEQMKEMRNYFIDKVLQEIPNTILNGDRENRLPSNVNFSFTEVEGEHLVIELDARGIACSTRSACEKEGGGSYVVKALGEKHLSLNAIRFSFSKYTNLKEIKHTIKILKKSVEKIRLFEL